ncbi:hypothetical protein SAMN04488063_1250 [Halopelagius inordinatus]|uniref:Exonuclease RecJ n=1 Tax=Halopelagius inordinatus TaxID=553467 RepID=A0A1I2NPJ7_9EURY|nr:hypothetical protein [Halopelagius inordinatus]SFG04669.1 hypothetical protein SAMN04488063_1250 [Halopelagius inordinatus]
MSAHPDPADAPDAPVESVAAALRDAPFVRVVCRADGDALAAGGLVARSLRTVGVPFHVRAVAFPEADAASSSEDDTLVSVGMRVPGADATIAPGDGTTSLRAHGVAEALTPEGETGPDPLLALAGVVAAGDHPGAADGSLLTVAEQTGAVERRPGIAAPVEDVADGLAHGTLAHASFSGDREAATAALAELGLPAELDAEAHRTVASLLALDVAGDDAATPRAAESVERALRPYATPDATFATLGGFADVLDAAARERPGTGVALALGHDARVPALDAWRDHATAVHAGIREGRSGRYESVFVVRATKETADSVGRLATVARLVRDFRSPEPVVLAVGNGLAAVAAVERGAADAASAVADEFGDDGGAWNGDARRAVARFDADAEEAEVIAAVREAST